MAKKRPYQEGKNNPACRLDVRKKIKENVLRGNQHPCKKPEIKAKIAAKQKETAKRKRKEKGIEDNQKYCPNCKLIKLITEFYKNCGYCKECKNMKQKNRKPKKELTEKYNRASLYKKYGITEEHYESLMNEQGSGCAICGKTAEAANIPYLYIDHDHSSGAVRGLLCPQCNFALGALRDDISLFTRAIAYLHKYSNKDKSI